MFKFAAPKPPLPKPKTFVPPQPSAQMPWAGQRGTMEDLSSFGVSPEDFFGGGGRIMFSDTAPKPALTPKQGSMTTQQQQAYINGFVKRAAEYGFNAAQLDDLLKQSDMQDILDKVQSGLSHTGDFVQEYGGKAVEGAKNLMNSDAVKKIQELAEQHPYVTSGLAGAGAGALAHRAYINNKRRREYGE